MEVRKMNSHDLKQFRDIFDEEMTREGFVWRYQMYMHVDFEQYWLIGLWPKVANIGYDFSIQFISEKTHIQPSKKILKKEFPYL